MRLAVIAAAAAAVVAWSDEAVGMLGAVVVIVPAAATGDSGRGNGADGMQSVQYQTVWDTLGSVRMGRSGVKDTVVCIRDKRQ